MECAARMKKDVVVVPILNKDGGRVSKVVVHAPSHGQIAVVAARGIGAVIIRCCSSFGRASRRRRRQRGLQGVGVVSKDWIIIRRILLLVVAVIDIAWTAASLLLPNSKLPKIGHVPPRRRDGRGHVPLDLVQVAVFRGSELAPHKFQLAHATRTVPRRRLPVPRVSDSVERSIMFIIAIIFVTAVRVRFAGAVLALLMVAVVAAQLDPRGAFRGDGGC